MRKTPTVARMGHLMLLEKGWVKRFGLDLGSGVVLLFGFFLSFHPFLMCPYPIRWFPVPSVIERLQRSPIWRGTCRSTRRILGFFGVNFSLLGAGRWWSRTPAWSVDGGSTSCTTCRGTWPLTRPRTRCLWMCNNAQLIFINIFPPDFPLTSRLFWKLCWISI